MVSVFFVSLEVIFLPDARLLVLALYRSGVRGLNLDPALEA